MRWIRDFSEGSREQRELLGGKGAGVAEMTRVLGAERVPAGFTITTEACVAYMQAGRELPDGLAEEVEEALAALEQSTGKVLGDPEAPLLVSVRSGARVSMPGMLDTVLNLGLNDESVTGLATSTDNERFAWDSYRRFVQMFGNVVRGIPGASFEQALQQAKDRAGVEADTELGVAELRELTTTFQQQFEEATGEAFPPRAPRAATPGDHRGVRLLGRSARGRLPPHQRHPRRLGHGGQRAADGLRQSRRALGLGRRLQPRRENG